MSTQDTFISHLVELRDRLLRSIYAVLGVFTLLWFWPGLAEIYDLLALPMIRTLPEGTHTITVRNADFAAHTVQVQVSADKPVTLRHRFGS